MGMKLNDGGAGRYAVNQNSDINVTPFVDVMLVLLIIFMVSMPTATKAIKLDLPPAQPPAEKAKEPLVINIQADGVYLGEQPTSIGSLTADLARRLDTANPTRERVYVRADRTVRYARLMEVMSTLQVGGYFQVALINEEL